MQRASRQWLDEAREKRIAELEATGQWHTAKRLRTCERPIITKAGKRIRPPCRRRECPVCAATVLYPGYLRKLRQGARKLCDPISIRFSIASRNEHDLAAAIDLLRKGLGKMRRRKSMKDVASGIGMLHPAHGRDKRWHPHFHLLIQADTGIDFPRIEADWKEVTSGWGYVALRPDDERDGRPLQGDPGDGREATAYIAHSDDWSPPDAGCNPDRYRVLHDAIEHRQLLVSWGIDGRGRKQGTGPDASCNDAPPNHRREHEAYLLSAPEAPVW